MEQLLMECRSGNSRVKVEGIEAVSEIRGDLASTGLHMQTCAVNEHSTCEGRSKEKEYVEYMENYYPLPLAELK